MKKDTRKGLTDKQLVKKYSNLEGPNFKEALNSMLKEPSPTASKKSEKQKGKRRSYK